MVEKKYAYGSCKEEEITELKINWDNYQYPEARLFEILGEEDVKDAEETADMDVFRVDFHCDKNEVLVWYEN